jgi:hypothetical protein
LDSDRLSRWLTLGANLGVIAGLVFVALEIKTNTESNRIAIDQNYSSNWMTINAALAINRELADIFERGLAGEELDRAELRQFQHLVSMYLTQSFHMLRLYDLGLISEQEIRDAFRALREYAQKGRFREHVLQIGNERRKNLILDPNGMDRWLHTVDDWAYREP